MFDNILFIFHIKAFDILVRHKGESLVHAFEMSLYNNEAISSFICLIISVNICDTIVCLFDIF